MFDWLHGAFHREDHPAWKKVENTVWTLIVGSILLFAVDLWLGPEHALAPTLAAVDNIVLWLFTLEVSLRVLSFRPASLGFWRLGPSGRLRAHVLGRILYCLDPFNLVDILTLQALHPALRGLRALRLLRLARGARLFRYSNPLHGTFQAFRDNALLYGLAFSLLMSATAVGGVSLYLVEGKQTEGLSTVADGLWWALVTLTTVGFGDIAPVTPLGRIIGSALMITGMFTLALFAGVVGHTLLHAVMSVREEQFRMSTLVDHIVICGYDPGARMLVDTLLTEVDYEAHALVVFAEGDRPRDLPSEYRWVSGDPTKESELDKVRLTTAHAVVVVGSRRRAPQAADANTILTAFTVRSYLASQEATKRRPRPLYMVSEILDAENVNHARTAGADEVIETTRLGFSMLTQPSCTAARPTS